MKKYFQQLKPLLPLGTGEKFKCNLNSRELKRIKVILYDVYGTILVSSSGDIHEFKHGKENIIRAFAMTEVECRGPIMDLEFGEAIIQEYLETIKRIHEHKKQRGISHPEVRIELVWRDVLKSLTERKLIKNHRKMNEKALAVSFEFLSNPSYPMPGLKQMLEDLTGAGYRLGIVSNAQFYTPLLLKYFLGEKEFLSGHQIPFFEDKLVKLSYQDGHAKPGLELFSGVYQALLQEKISPDQVLFLGNDMLNDIYPARVIGFKTALFAGDKRSLKWRKYAIETRGLIPDMIMTHLDQVYNLFAS